MSASCLSTAFCVGSTWDGQGTVSTQPTAGASAWPIVLAVAPQAPAPPAMVITGISVKRGRRQSANIRFIATAPPYSTPILQVAFAGETARDPDSPTADGLDVQQSARALQRLAHVTAAGREVPFTATNDGGLVDLDLRTPERSVTVTLPVTIAAYLLQPSKTGLRQTQALFGANDEIDGGGETIGSTGFFDAVKIRVARSRRKHHAASGTHS